MQKPRAKRYQIWFPMSFDSETRKDGMAVSRNLSSSGVLMATASDLSEGAAVTVTFNLTLGDTEHTVEGRIVRVEHNATEGMWPHNVAVQFDEPIVDIEPLLAELPASQRNPTVEPEDPDQG
jgi:PilZ domain